MTKASDSLRNRLGLGLGSFRVFLVFAIIFVALVSAVIAGLIFTSRAFPQSLGTPGGGLLDGLIANGISVIVSTILIAPLTAYFVNMRREQQLVPVRKSFVLSIASGIDRIAMSHIHHFALFGFAVLALRDGMAVNTLKQGMDLMKEIAEQLHTSFTGAAHTPFTDSSILSKAVHDAQLLAGMVEDFYDVAYRETAVLENTLTFALPLFPVDVITDLHDIRQILMDYRGNLQDMLAVVGGADDPRIAARAKYSVLDFRKLIDKVGIVAKSAAVNNEADYMSNAAEFVKLDVLGHTQQKIAEELVLVFEEARKYDAQLRQTR
jgi:hypothetical protein